VFKVIDNQDQIEKGQSSFHWENPQARKVMSTATGVICAELVKDFLEFYKLDYTLAIFMPEVNLNTQKVSTKEELSKKVGLREPSSQKPVMAQLIESFLTNERPSSQNSTAPPAKVHEEEKSFNAQLHSNKAPAAPVEKFSSVGTANQASNAHDVSKASAKS
jgi:FGFR1 oncogene partner